MAELDEEVARLTSTEGDPTSNVLSLVSSAVRRLDDLREQESRHRAEMDRFRDATTKEREELNRELRRAETARIDAIRAVDIGAVSRAAEVSAQQAATLAVQVSTLAETLRGQVSAAAAASATALATSLEPILKRLEELSRVQYEQQGQRAQQTETRGVNQWAIGFALSAVLALMSFAGFIIYVVTHHPVASSVVK